MKKLFYLFVFVAMAQNVSAQNCSPATAYQFLDINNVKARINNGGDMWWDLVNDAQYIVPQTGNVSSLFAGAIWIGGIDAEGQLRVAAQTYRQLADFPGPLDENGNITNQACSDFDRIWKINKSTIDSFKAGLFSITPNTILQWPGRGNPNLTFVPNQDVAPFVDMNGDDLYDPAFGDYPDVPGDQALWFVFNDKGNVHGETGGGPLGIEIQCTAYSFEGSGSCLFNTTFYHYRIMNKGLNEIDSTYVGLWSDPDLGCFLDDYIGCDTSKNLGIVYNGSASDGGSGCAASYGSTPPILAIDFLQGPVDENNVTHYMDHFMYYTNDFAGAGNPMNANDYYGYLKSVFAGGDHLTFGGDGVGGTTNTNYAFSGDPSDVTGWSECTENDAPSDRRMVISSGPFQFDPGSEKTLDFAVVWDNTTSYPCPSFSNIKDVADCVKNYFDSYIKLTGVTSLNGSLKDHMLEMFPNPVLQNEVIVFDVKNADRIDVIDIAGRVLESIQAKNQSTIQLKASLPREHTSAK